MAPSQLQWNLVRAKSQIYVFWLLLQNLLTAHGMSGWGGCLDGQDVYAAVKENSQSVILVSELFGDYNEVVFTWSVGGKDADWFFLDGTNLWLNTSEERVLDRETEGSVLMGELMCFEEDRLQSVYRIVIEILNENDNRPEFVDGSSQTFVISELSPVNAVVFKVQATDADNDKIIYSIDPTSPDADYFRVELPNSGEVVLSRPLDYETKTLLSLTIYASEMNTAERFNTSVNVSVRIQDADDQYPQFMPCTLLFEDVNTRVCTSPTYTVNVTEGAQDVVLDFSPGPIHAVDGDSGLSSSLSYAILTGNEDGHFYINRQTGEVTLTNGVTDRLTTPALHLQIMAFQNNDPRKYSIAPAVVHVLGLNQFHPEFEKPEYYGFVTTGYGPACLVHTYGSRALVLHVIDQDFNQGVNPLIRFSVSPTSNHSELYRVTQEGLLIAKIDLLTPRDKHVLQVTAFDPESGDSTSTTVIIEILTEGQTAPHSESGEQRVSGCVVGKAVFLCLTAMTCLTCLLYLGIWVKKRLGGHRDSLERGCVAQGKHPNVSLSWFQLVSHGSGMPQTEDLPFSHEHDDGTPNPSFRFTEHDIPSALEPTNPDDNVFNADIPVKKSDKPTPIASSSANDDLTESSSLESLPVQASVSIPETNPASQNTEEAVSPSPLLSNRIASAEIDKPMSKATPYSPLLSAKQPPSPEQVPFKARLVHISWSPCKSPRKALGEQEAVGQKEEEEIEPSTSLDNSDHSGDRDSPDLLSDEEELLNIMARCNPVFITLKK